MRIKKPSSGVHEGDLTPMIDMTFQLIAFFMVLINFSQTESHAEIKLPSSELARPPVDMLEYPITLHLGQDGTVFFSGESISLDSLRPYLVREKEALEHDEKTASQATVIVRAHELAPAGKVQELIQICQQNNFEKFALRAKDPGTR